MGWWTKERVKALKKFMGQSLSAKDIAVKLGPGFTKNMVIGKARREGLVFARTSCVEPQVRKHVRARQLDRPIDPAPEPMPEIEPEPIMSLSKRPTLDELEPHHCRFPIGDPMRPEFRFCGQEKFAGLSYCARHAKVCFQNFIPGVGMVYQPRSHKKKKEYV